MKITAVYQQQPHQHLYVTCNYIVFNTVYQDRYRRQQKVKIAKFHTNGQMDRNKHLSLLTQGNECHGIQTMDMLNIQHILQDSSLTLCWLWWRRDTGVHQWRVAKYLTDDRHEVVSTGCVKGHSKTIVTGPEPLTLPPHSQQSHSVGVKERRSTQTLKGHYTLLYDFGFLWLFLTITINHWVWRGDQRLVSYPNLKSLQHGSLTVSAPGDLGLAQRLHIPCPWLECWLRCSKSGVRCSS